MVLGEAAPAALNDLSSPGDTAPTDRAPTKPVGSALMSVFQVIRQETVVEEYTPMSPQIEEG